jgi:hypothetical protein
VLCDRELPGVRAPGNRGKWLRCNDFLPACYRCYRCYRGLTVTTASVRRTDERSQILSALLTADEPISPKDISVATESTRNSTDQLLYKMAKDRGDRENRSRTVHSPPTAGTTKDR